MSALTWPLDFYASDHAIGLALCVAHHGEHVWRVDHCLQLHEPPRVGRYGPCMKHDGRHMDVVGQCVHWGARYAIRPGRCLACSEPIMNRLDLQTGRTVMIGEGDDVIHAHPRQPEPEQDLDPSVLARAIVLAARELRGERQYKPEPPAPPEPTSERREPSPDSILERYTE